MNNVSIVVDGVGIITVPENKATLSLELIQHFTPNWQKMIKDGQAEGKHMSSIEYVEACLTNLAIEHTITRCPVVYVTIAESDEMASIPEEGPAEEPHAIDPPVDETPAEEPAPFVDPPMEPAPKEEFPLEEMTPSTQFPEGEKAPAEEAVAGDEMAPVAVGGGEDPEEPAAPWD